MSTSLLLAIVAFLTAGSVAGIVWGIGSRITRVEKFLEHLEHRIIVLQQAEFSRRMEVERERWRKQFGEVPPKTLVDDVRMTFDVLPPFKQCEASLDAVLRK